MDSFLQSQLGINLALQQIGGLTTVMQFITFFGTEDFFTIALAVTYLCVSVSVGMRLGAIVILGDSVGNLVKLAFHSPRPYWIDSRVQALSTEPTYGIPSSHAQNGVSVWFFVAYVMRRQWAWIAAGVIVLLLTLSRVYLGVHFLSDVIGGWVIGAVFLIAYLWVEGKLRARLVQLDLRGQIGVALALAVSVLILGIGVQTVIANSPDSPQWATFAKESRSLDPLVARAGVIFGGGVGFAMMFRSARFNAADSLRNRFGRLIIGLGGALIIRFALGAIFPRGEDALSLSLRAARYGLMAWWVAYLTPWLALKVKLAERG